MNEICTHIADIDYNAIILYPGGYDDWSRPRAKCAARSSKKTPSAQEDFAAASFVLGFGGTRGSQAEPQEAIERLTLTDLKRSNIDGSSSSRSRALRSKPEPGRRVQEWPEITVCDGCAPSLPRRKNAVIGKSGVGKTTLCKMLMGKFSPTQVDRVGRARRSATSRKITAPTFRRHHRCQLLALVRAERQLQTVRGLLGRMLFKGEEATKPTAALSGAKPCVDLLQVDVMEDNVLIWTSRPITSTWSPRRPR